jgi:hypothetical protein
MSDGPMDLPLPKLVETVSTTAVSRRRGRLLGSIAAFCAVVLAIAIVLVVTGGAGPIPSAAAAESVRNAVAATFRSDTLGIDFTATVTAESQGFTLTGKGGCILKLPACNFTLVDSGRSPSGDTVEKMHEVITPTTSYVELPPSLANRVSEPWISEPTSKTNFDKSTSSLGGNPLSAVAALAHADGGEVSSVGSVIVDGVRTKEYLVHISADAIDRGVSKEFVSLPSWIRAKVDTVMYAGSTMYVYVTDGGHVAKLKVSTTYSVQGVTAQITVIERITSLRARVVVHAPPAADVMTMAQFESQLEGQGG